jgi:hypothetical protein
MSLFQVNFGETTFFDNLLELYILYRKLSCSFMKTHFFLVSYFSVTEIERKD